MFDEDRYFERSHETRLVPFQGRNLGISICEDAWNDQDFWSKRRYHTDPICNQVQMGADLLINLSSSPFEMYKPLVRYRMLLGHVAKYRVPLLYVNLVGGNDDLLFDGNSLAFGRTGNLIAQGKSFCEDLLLVDPDSEQDAGLSRRGGDAEPVRSSGDGDTRLRPQVRLQVGGPRIERRHRLGCHGMHRRRGAGATKRVGRIPAFRLLCPGKPR